MIVYRESERTVTTGPLLSELQQGLRAQAMRRIPLHGPATDLLIEFGELEAALADRLLPTRDGWPPTLRLARRISVGIGHLFRCAWRGIPSDQAPVRPEALLGALRTLVQLPLPRTLTLRAPEGYTHYGLYPETYLEAARRFSGEHPASHAVVVGLRSIGTSLSAVVTAELEAAGWSVSSLTLRPRGAVHDRRIDLTRELACRLAADAAWWVVVDEGPGMSGSSFCGTAEGLEALGVPSARITFFCSWDPDPGTLTSPRARARWTTHRRLWVPFEEVWPRLEDAPFRDLSGGAWRQTLGYGPAAVHPHHERRKLLCAEPRARGDLRLFRFAGLGHYGRGKLSRAHLLAEAGFTPPLVGWNHGFIVESFLRGRPLRALSAQPGFLAQVSRYLACIYKEFAVGEAIDLEQNLAMMRENVAELLGDAWAARVDPPAERHRNLLCDQIAVAVDGRMLPHEWIRTRGGWFKTDALDHHDDHFFTGRQDIAWDLAGCAVELGLSDGALATLLQSYVRRSGDRGVAARLPFYNVAYLACRGAYAVFAVRTLGDSPERAGFAALGEKYREGLKAAILRLQRTGERRG